MSHPIQLISTDFDGTLHSDFGFAPIPEKTLQMIDRLQQQGVKWVINTGRDMPSLMEGLYRSGVKMMPDALVLVEREVHVFKNSAFESVETWNNACYEDHQQVFRKLRSDIPRLTSWVQTSSKAQIYEDAYSPFCLIAANNAEGDAIQEYMEDYCGEVPGLTVVRNSIYVRFSHHGYNKGTSLDEVRRLFGIAVENTFAIGDHLNDLPMLQLKHAKHLAAPSNAIDEVKNLLRKQGGYISPHPEGLGVADALEYFMK